MSRDGELIGIWGRQHVEEAFVLMSVKEVFPRDAAYERSNKQGRSHLICRRKE
jgi:hypothetical protein